VALTVADPKLFNQVLTF